MMAEESEASAAAALKASAAATAQSGDEEARRLQLQRLETEKQELLEKLKKAMAGVRALKKQLEDAQAETARLQVETRDLAALRQDLQRQEDEKQEIVDKLQDVVDRYQALQQELEGKDGELMLAQSKVEAFQVELQSQQDEAAQRQEKDAQSISELNDELQKTTRRLAQEEARVMVFQEENNRLTHQVAAMLEDKQQQERETQELMAESRSLQAKVGDLAQQVSGARQQQEDTEQMYLEVASKLNQALRDNDELRNRVTGMTNGSEKSNLDLNADNSGTATAGDRVRELEEQIAALESKAAEWQTSAEKWELEKKELTQQVGALTASSAKAQVKLAEVAEIREQLLVNVGIDLTYESIESLLDTKTKEIQMLTEQIAALEGPQEQAISDAVIATMSEAESLRSQLDALRSQYDALASKKLGQDKTVEELHIELQRVAEKHTTSLSAHENEHQRQQAEYLQQAAKLTAQLEDMRVQNHQLDNDFATVRTKIVALVQELQTPVPVGLETEAEAGESSRLAMLELYLEHIREQLVGEAKTDVDNLRSEANILKDQIQTYETTNEQLSAKLEECETALKARASEIEKLAVKGLENSSDAENCSSHNGDVASVLSNDDTTESCNGGASSLERELEAANARLHAVKAEMAACKAENLRMIFEVAKTADGVSKLKKDHEALLESHREKSSKMDAMVTQLESLESANQTLEMHLKSKSDDLRCHLEAFSMQKEDFQSVIANLNRAVFKTEKENSKIKRDLEDIKNENDVLEERINELHAVADSKTEPDESLEKDREVEELRSSLVQAKVNFLEQKQQLTALEKKLVEVSQKSGGATCTVNTASLEAERREFETALIEMIEMEQKLQVAYEAKQGLESTLQERLEAKTELENRLSVAEDKIVELEQQLEQKVALIATIEEQLRSVEEEREKLSDEFAKTKSKLERSRGKLEEKAIEFEAFKTTTNMLKDERSRLFNEISLLQEKISKSEEQKAAMANSQELANEELEEQLNELADKIAEIESEKQELRARLEENAYRSEEDIHQLRERLYMTEEEKSRLDEENAKLEETIQSLETKFAELGEQKADLEAAYKARSEQLTLLEAQVKQKASEIATLSAEKKTLTDSKESLEESVSALHEETSALKHNLDETSSKLRNELDQVTAQVEDLQAQLAETAAKRDEVAAALAEVQARAQADKLANDGVTAKLESQIAENEALEIKVTALKHMAEKALQSVQSNRDELSEAESRSAVLVLERDAARTALDKQGATCEKLTAQQEELQQQVDKLNSELESSQRKYAEETRATEETIRCMKDAKTHVEDSLRSVKEELAEAESCVMVLVEERDAARKGLSAKDLKIEMLTTQQGENDLAVQKLENKLQTLQNKNSAEIEAAQETIRDLRESAAQAEETARSLLDSSAQAEESLQAIREQLTDSELRVAELEKERDATRTSLNEKVSTHETLSALQEDLQIKVNALESELKEQQETSAANLAAASETIASLKSAEAEGAETLASLRRELSEAEGCVMVLVEERDAAKKALSKNELKLEVLSSEHGELELKSQSVATELETLRTKSSADAQAVKETIQQLKAAMACTTESLESAQSELSESESRVAALTAERDSLNRTMSDLNAEHQSLQNEKENLLERIEGLETDFNHLQTQHSAELESTEETIRALKASEAEVTETLNSARQELSQKKILLASLNREHDAIKTTLADKGAYIETLNSKSETLQERTHTLEAELEQLQSQGAADTQTAEEMINSLKASKSETADTLETIRQQLSEAEARLVSVEEERDTASKTASELVSHSETQSTQVESLQERIHTLEAELEQLQSQRAADAQTAGETINRLKALESETAKTLETVRQQLSEAETRLVSVEEERDAVSKTASELASHREAQSTEVESLQERIHTLEVELKHLESQRAADAQTAGETINRLKASESETAETLETVRQHLSEAETRLVSVEEERDAVSKTASELASHREAQSTEVESLQERIHTLEVELKHLESQRAADAQTAGETIKAQSTEVESLHERIHTLEAELECLQSQRAADAQTSGETINSLKASESETAKTLETVRQQLSEAETRLVSVEEERETVNAALMGKDLELKALRDEKLKLSSVVQANGVTIGELQSQLQAELLKLSDAAQQIEMYQTQITELGGQLRDQVQAVEVSSTKEIKTLKEQIASLSESSKSASEEMAALRGQKVIEEKCHADSIAQKDEVITTLKSKLEEVMVAYKRLKGHLQELQERLTQQTKTNDTLKVSYDELNVQHSTSAKELDALKLEFASSQGALAEELRQAGDKLADSEAQRENQMDNFKKRVLAYDDELAQAQRQHDVALHEQKETLLAASAAREEASELKLSELEKLCATLTETVHKKEDEVQTLVERVRVVEQKHAQVGNDREEADRKHEAELMELEAQLSSANEMLEKLRATSTASVDSQHKTVSQLESHIGKLKLQVETEKEGANAARAALETYKKRAHIALKKAASENKLNLKKAAQTATKLEQEVVTAKGRVNILETELEETRKRMAELECAGDARAQSARDALESEKRSQEATLLSEMDALKAEIARLEGALENEKAPLEVQIAQLTERNEALAHEVASLKEQVLSHNETLQQEIGAKEDEISELSKQLQAALAAAASLATNEAERRTYSPASSPTEKERRSLSTASSSRSYECEGNNSFLQATIEEQHEHIAAAVADSCPIPLASKMANGADQQSRCREDNDEAVNLKLQLNELEGKAHLFQKKFEDVSALLEEANRQKQRLQELNESTQAINIEYLKNVLMKYIESQVQSEKEQLVPVISTLLHFSPQEHQKVVAAHSKANDEGAGIFGGVFSLWGSGSAASAPKPLAAPQNFKPSPSPAKGNTNGAALGSKDKNGVLTFGSDEEEEEEYAAVLNPFAT